MFIFILINNFSLIFKKSIQCQFFSIIFQAETYNINLKQKILKNNFLIKKPKNKFSLLTGIFNQLNQKLTN